jgi:hypothetical protein
MYGILINPFSIYTIENHVTYFEKVRERINNKDILILLNSVVCDIKPLNENNEQNINFEELEHYSKIKIEYVSGDSDIYLNNTSIKTSDIVDGSFYNDENILIVNNENKLSLGV